MRQNNIKKIEKALECFSNQSFTIADICKKTNISDPTIRNYFKVNKSLDVQEVSYGRYQITSPGPLLEIPSKIKNTLTTEQKELNTSNMKRNTPPTQEKQPSQNHQDPNLIQVHGDLYLNAYLKGFDRGFELGLKKASEISKTSK
jgi:hypothetical protein